MRTPKSKPASKGLAKRAGTKASARTKKKEAQLTPFRGSVTHLIHRAEQCAGDMFARIAPAGVVTPRQYAILDAIAENPGISQTGLVDRTGIDRSTLADIVRRMLDKGLVQRERTVADARAYAVKLTRKGTSTLARMRPLAATVDRQMLGAIPKEQRELFLSVLAHMVASLSQDDDEQAT
jgi:DNA-binding MarR family transcriptional regulator